MDVRICLYQHLSHIHLIQLLFLTWGNADNNTEDGELHITLQKREKGKTWSSPIQGQGILDPYAADQEQKRLMLQRFQEEV